MTKLFAFCSFLFFCFASAAQNLVPNPSFEEYNGCPKTSSQFDYCEAWMSFRNNPDYFNECSEYFMGVPNNMVAHQYAAEGVAYSGIAGFWPVNPNWREHIGVMLVDPLEIGTTYYASFWISKSEKLQMNIAHNMHGIRFSTYETSNGGGTPLLNWAHIWSEEVIIDTINWVQIKGSFTADSAYTYMAIGNFFDDDHTEVVYLQPNQTGEAYYLVDDVRLSTDSTIAFTTGINQLLRQPEIMISPNPVHDFLMIQTEAGAKEWRIIDMTGRCVDHGRFDNIDLKVPVSELSVGIYIFQIVFSDNRNISKKFYKQKKT